MPTPTINETQEEYMQRCIPIVHSEDPNKTDKQCTAQCYSMYREWQEKQNAAALYQIDPSAVPDEYKRPLIHGALIARHIYTSAFEWTPPIDTAMLPPHARIYQCVFGKEGDWVKSNDEIWVMTAQEIERMSRTIIGGFIEHNHIMTEIQEGALVIDAEPSPDPTDGKVVFEALIYTNGHTPLDASYDKNEITGLSIDFFPRTEHPLNDGTKRQEERGIFAVGVAYLTPPATPACTEGTSIKLIATGTPCIACPNKKAATSQSRGDTQKMSQEEIKKLLEPINTKLATLEATVTKLETAAANHHEMKPDANQLKQAFDNFTKTTIEPLTATVANIKTQIETQTQETEKLKQATRESVGAGTKEPTDEDKAKLQQATQELTKELERQRAIP